MPDIAGQAAASDLPCYGITLGDIGYNTANTDYTNAVFPLMKRAMQAQKTGLPLFQLMGNHDYEVISVSKEEYTDAHDIAAQRNFEYAFGPINYSFDRGDVHIVAMDDMNYEALHRLAPSREAAQRIFRMTEFCRQHPGRTHVPDPYYEGREGFELVLDLLEDGCRGLLERISAR